MLELGLDFLCGVMVENVFELIFVGWVVNLVVFVDVLEDRVLKVLVFRVL